MGALAEDHLGRLHNRLAQRGVGVDAHADVAGERAHLDGESSGRLRFLVE